MHSGSDAKGCQSNLSGNFFPRLEMTFLLKKSHFVSCFLFFPVLQKPSPLSTKQLKISHQQYLQNADLTSLQSEPEEAESSSEPDVGRLTGGNQRLLFMEALTAEICPEAGTAFLHGQIRRIKDRVKALQRIQQSSTQRRHVRAHCLLSTGPEGCSYSAEPLQNQKVQRYLKRATRAKLMSERENLPDSAEVQQLQLQSHGLQACSIRDFVTGTLCQNP